MSSPNGDELSGDLELSIQGVAAREQPDGTLEIVINSSRGEIPGVLHPCEGWPDAALFVGGALGGLDGPAGGLYPRLAQSLLAEASEDASQRLETAGLSSLRLHYRQPGEFQECVLDVLGGISFLKGIGGRRVALVGHSFGAAVVIKAGELSDAVAGVAALSPQLYGTRSVQRLTPKPLLLVHGEADNILDSAASRDIYDRAEEPKRLVLYEGAGHGLMECRQELFDLLEAWIRDTVDHRES